MGTSAKSQKPNAMAKPIPALMQQPRDEDPIVWRDPFSQHRRKLDPAKMKSASVTHGKSRSHVLNAASSSLGGEWRRWERKKALHFRNLYPFRGERRSVELLPSFRAGPGFCETVCWKNWIIPSIAPPWVPSRELCTVTPDAFTMNKAGLVTPCWEFL